MRSQRFSHVTRIILVLDKNITFILFKQSTQETLLYVLVAEPCKLDSGSCLGCGNESKALSCVMPANNKVSDERPSSIGEEGKKEEDDEDEN